MEAYSADHHQADHIVYQGDSDQLAMYNTPIMFDFPRLIAPSAIFFCQTLTRESMSDASSQDQGPDSFLLSETAPTSLTVCRRIGAQFDSSNNIPLQVAFVDFTHVYNAPGGRAPHGTMGVGSAFETSVE